MDDKTTKAHGDCSPSSDWVLVEKDGSQEREQTTVDLITHMSNELQCEFNAVLGFSQIALDTDLTQNQRQLLTGLNRSAEQLQSMFHDLQLFQKIEANRLVPACAPFSLSDVTVNAMAALIASASEKDLDFTYEVGSAVRNRVIGDWSYLHQILVRILRSVVKFSDFGKINLAVSMSDEEKGSSLNHCAVQFVLSYRESHPIAGKVRDPLRDVDWKLHQCTGSFCERHELGLFIAQRLVGLMGGKIWTEGGLGLTTLHVRLPFELDDRNDFSQLQWILGKSSPDGKVLLLDEGGVGFKDEVMRHLGQQGAEPTIVKINCNDDSLPPEVQNAGRRDFWRAVVESSRAAGKLREDEKFKSNPVLVVGPELSVDLSFVTMDGAVISTKQDGPGFRSLSILVAEDHLVNQKIFRKFLENGNHTFQIVNNGLEAFERAKERRFDIILMDLSMPVMAGFEATAKIREWESENNILRTPIIGLTASHFNRGQCLGGNMDDTVRKPLNYTVLWKTIHRNVGRFI